MLFLVRDSRDDSLKRFTISEYNRFITTYNLEKSKMRKTCKKLYTGNDGRNWHKGFRLEDIIDENLEQELEKSSRLVPEYTFRPISYVDLGQENIHNKVDETMKKLYPSVNNKDVYTAILLGDEHFKYESKPAINIVYKFIEKYKNDIDEVLFGGDGIDASGLGKHLNLEEEKHDLYQEMEAFKNYAEKIKNIVPKAKFSIVEDNHYHLRKARFIAENPAMKNMIKDIKFDFDEVSKHGKPYFPLREYGNNLIAGIHGIFFNDVFTKNNTVNYPMNIFQFHTHTIQTYKGNNGLISYGIPCLCKKEMAYLQNRPTRWENGFGILKYFPKEHRYSIEYCIINNNIGIYRDEVYHG